MEHRPGDLQAQPLIVLAHSDPDTRQLLHDALVEAGFSVNALSNWEELHETIYTQFPQCIVLDLEWSGAVQRQRLQLVERHNVFSHFPVIGVFRGGPDSENTWADAPVDDYVVEPVDATELAARVRLSLARRQRDVNANPLTGLPGNLTIMREADRRLANGEPFALAHFDIDHFKAFNDTYGFERGDEVLRMTALVLANTLQQYRSPDTYVGQVGGDDFVFMTPPDIIRGACESIIRHFDQIVLRFYDDEHRQQGCIHTEDRDGQIRTYPLMSCSIGVVVAGRNAISHIADLSARVNQMKKYTKSLSGSNYVIDRRK